MFLTHRLHLAKSAMQAGFDVTVICNITVHRDLLEKHGLNVIDLKSKRGSKNPFRIIPEAYRLNRILKRLKPDIIQPVALKPIILSGLYSILNSKTKKIFCITGVGFIFISQRLTAKILKQSVKTVISKILNCNNSIIVVQNKDDDYFVRQSFSVSPEKIRLISGAGVDTNIFIPQVEPQESPVVVALPARLLVDKGVYEFVEVARKVNGSRKIANFRLIGDVDLENPNSIQKEEIENWVKQDLVEWVGFAANMVTALEQVHIICFPSYREGLPKALLEALACSKPVVAFDVPGCREVVKNGENGYLIRFMDVDLMASKVEDLALNSGLREKFGVSGRNFVEHKFGQGIIQSQFKRLWAENFSL